MKNPLRPTEGVRPHRLSLSRLFAFLVIFLIASGYAIWKSGRFQTMIQGVSQGGLSDALGVPVSFRTVDIRFFPPSVRLADVRIGNDPRLGIPANRPLFEAEEVSVGGGVSLAGNELRLGRIRAVRPRVRIVQTADGRTNLPPGLSRPSTGGGVKLRVGSVLVQEGSLEFNGRKADIDGRFEGFAAELTSTGTERYRGRLVVRRALLRLPDSEPIAAELSSRFVFDAARGVMSDEILLGGSFGQLRVSGVIAGPAGTVLSADGEVSIEEVERLFRADLGFRGRAQVSARVQIPPGGAFRIAGRIESPLVRSDPFTIEGFAASAVATSDSLLAEIERASLDGGHASGTLRIGNLTGDVKPMTLALEGTGISLERFFGDLDLKGTGLSGSAALSVALRWGKEGLTRANGGGTVRIDPGTASSIVRGRFGMPTAGGGPVSIVSGRIGLEGVAIRFPQSTLDLHGGLKIGVWQPDFDLQLKSRDLTEVDRLFQNFLAATGSKPEPLGLGGTGEIQGHLAGKWTDPEATVQIAAEEARYSGVRFGSVRGTVEMRGGAFYFRPLRVYEGDAALALEGMARYKIVRNLPRFDLFVSARSYPISRLLEYLDFKYPVEGRVTGAFPVSGTPEALSGGGPVELRDAVLWGQKIPALSARVLFTPGHLSLEGLTAAVDGGMVRGNVAFAITQKTFSARLAGDAIPLSAIDALKASSKDLSGTLSFQVSGGGSVDRPDLDVSAAVSQATIFEHAVPEALSPRVEVALRRGVLDASLSVPGHWSFRAQGDVFGSPARVEVALDAADLNSFLLFTPLQLAPGRAGSLAINGSLVLPAKAGDLPTGTFTVTRARLDLPDHPGVLATAGAVRAALGRGRLTFDEFHAVGQGSDLKINGFVELGQTPRTLNVAVSGPLDASLLSLAAPDTGLSGRLRMDVRATGSLDAPQLAGTVRIESGRYRINNPPVIVDDLEGLLTFHGARGDVEARAKVRGGDAFAAGSFTVAGLALRDFRFSVQARRVSLPYPEDMRLIVDADLVASGGPAGNQVRGEVTLLRGTYSKDFEITLSDLLARSRPSAVAAVEPWKEQTTLEVRIVSAASLEVRTNVARLTATVDVVARGTVADPVLVGQIVLDEGGRVQFRDVRYDIEAGTITFANTRGFAPILDIRARAEVKGYDLTVSLVGTWPRIQSSFSSDPPLPDESVIGLLLTGTAPSGRTESDTSSSIVSVGAGIAAGAATGYITKPTQKLFKLDRFEIDPVFTGAGQLSDVRSTVGKQITPNLLVTYSQSFDTSKLPIVQFEWRLSNNFVLRGQRDENGVYLVDLRRRQRL